KTMATDRETPGGGRNENERGRGDVALIAAQTSPHQRQQNQKDKKAPIWQHGEALAKGDTTNERAISADPDDGDDNKDCDRFQQVPFGKSPQTHHGPKQDN